jgi:hypothetical protein
MRQTARVLATSSEASDRNGEEALKLPEEAVRLSANQDPEISALAIASANVGKFPEALDTDHRALELATQQNQSALLRQLTFEIRLCQAGQPLRDRLSQ